MGKSIFESFINQKIIRKNTLLEAEIFKPGLSLPVKILEYCTVESAYKKDNQIWFTCSIVDPPIKIKLCETQVKKIDGMSINDIAKAHAPEGKKRGRKPKLKPINS